MFGSRFVQERSGLVSSISFVATANCAAYCGSKIDFVDVILILLIFVLKLGTKATAKKNKKLRVHYCTFRKLSLNINKFINCLKNSDL